MTNTVNIAFDRCCNDLNLALTGLSDAINIYSDIVEPTAADVTAAQAYCNSIKSLTVLIRNSAARKPATAEPLQALVCAG